jgi:putative membrane protein insertion efficiency factor
VKTLHRLSRLIGAPARAVLIAGIRVYQATLSGAFGDHCRFYPSCSHYAETAIRTHGATKGSAMAIWRILRCNPFGRGGFEPVPPSRPHARYDNLIPSAEEARP